MPNVDQLLWNDVADWERGEFAWTTTANPPGVLTIGWPQRNLGIERFLYRFAGRTGNTVRNQADERQVATISGIFEWRETDTGVRFLRLNPGEVSIPTDTAWGIDRFLLGAMIRVANYPASDMLVIGQSVPSLLSIHLTRDGYLRLPIVEGSDPAISRTRVPRNAYVAANIEIVPHQNRILGFTGFMNGYPIGSIPNHNFAVGAINRTNFTIGPGSFDLFSAWLSAEVDQVKAPQTQGAWLSEIFDIGFVQRLTAITVRGVIKEGSIVKFRVILSESSFMADLEAAQGEFTEPGSFVLPNMVHGRYGRVELQLATQAAETPPIISELCLHFGEYPFAAPVHIPLSTIPEEDLQVFAVPKQEMRVSARGVASPESIKISSGDSEVSAVASGRTFTRTIRSRKGWPEFGRLSNRNFISAYPVGSPLWFVGMLRTPTEILGQPLVTESGTVIARGADCWFAWDGWGKELWHRRDPFPIIGEGVTTLEYLIWPTSQDIRCADLRDGSLVWTFVPATPPSGILSVLESGLVLVPLRDGVINFLNISGTLSRAINTGLGAGAHLDTPYVDVPYAEVFHNDTPAKIQLHADHSDHVNHTESYTAGGVWRGPPIHTNVGVPGEIGHRNVTIVVTPGHRDFVGLHHDTLAHDDVAHTDVAHNDTAHSDASHSDTAHADIRADGSGVRFTDEGHQSELLLVFPAFAIVLNQLGQVVSTVHGRARMTAAVLNDDIAGDASSIRLVHAGFEDGSIRTFTAETGAVLFERTLDSRVHFVVNIPGRGIPLLAGTERRLYLMKQNLDSIWEIDLPTPPSGWPTFSGEDIVVCLTDRVMTIKLDGLVDATILPRERLSGSPVVMKPGTLLVPSESGVLVFGSPTRAPFIHHRVWPTNVHVNEGFYLLDESSEIFGEVPTVRWFFKGKQLDGPMQKEFIEHAGTHEVTHLAWNELGQRREQKIRLRVLPSFVEERPLVWKVEQSVPKVVSVLVRSEDEMRIFYPDEGIGEVYQDQPVQLDLEVFGLLRNITGATVRFIVKASESETEPTLLNLPGTITQAIEGRARIEITAANWRTLPPGTYFWGIYVTYPTGRVELGGRGRLELRAALS